MTSKEKRETVGTFKAGAFMCPRCCIELVEVDVDFQIEDIVLSNVKILRCPLCEEELFTPEQLDAINERIRSAHECPK